MNQFITDIYRWYTNHKRDLPWRDTNDPYKIWISEIILQQTRVDQGIHYYIKFIERYPTIHHLAGAGEDEVLKLWQGLGYYTRARNLLYTARYISIELNGKFPGNYQEIHQLKGVGPYTASAIASIAFKLPYPSLDGNVYRLLARYFGISALINSGKGKKEFWKLAAGLMPEKNPGFHNQALMEFGALQCVPQLPACINCPLKTSCYAYKNRMVSHLPVKAKKGKPRNRYFNYFFIESKDYTWLEKRTGRDIWKNLYQFPLMETAKKLSDHEIINMQEIPFLKHCDTKIHRISAYQKHILSHQIIFARLIHLKMKEICLPDNNFIRVDKKNISEFAVPRLIEKLLNETDYL